MSYINRLNTVSNRLNTIQIYQSDNKDPSSNPSLPVTPPTGYPVVNNHNQASQPQKPYVPKPIIVVRPSHLANEPIHENYNLPIQAPQTQPASQPHTNPIQYPSLPITPPPRNPIKTHGVIIDNPNYGKTVWPSAGSNNFNTSLIRPIARVPEISFKFDNNSYISGYYRLTMDMYMNLQSKFSIPNLKVTALVGDTVRMNNDVCTNNTFDVLQMLVDIVTMFNKTGIDIRFINQSQRFDMTMVNSIDQLNRKLFSQPINWQGDNYSSKALKNIINTAIESKTPLTVVYLGGDIINDSEDFIETIIKGFELIPNFKIKIFNVGNSSCYSALKSNLKQRGVVHCVYNYDARTLFTDTVRDCLLRG